MDILITIDVEASSYQGRPLPFSKMVDGEIDGQYYGIAAIMDICEKFGARGTFFVDVFEYANAGEPELKRVCEAIKSRGHSVELHTHPSRIWDRMCMKDYALEEQRDIIRKGRELLKKWTGEDPIAHRAGSFGANTDTLIALADEGFKVDSSSFSSYKHCRLDLPIVNQVSKHSGILQVPPTLFATLRLGSYQNIRNLDVDTCTFSELRHVIDQGRRKGLKAATILLHSFSFVQRNADSTRFWPDEKDRDRFIKIMDYISEKKEYRFVTMRELYHSYLENRKAYEGKDFIPYSGIRRTFIRACKRWKTSRKNRLFIIGMMSALVLLIFLIIILISLIAGQLP